MPLLLVCGAWLTGVVAGNATPVSPLAVALFSLPVVLVAALAPGPRRRRLAAAALLLLALGGYLRTEVHRQGVESDPLEHVRGTVSLRGVVAAEPDLTDASLRWDLDVTALREGRTGSWRPSGGRVRVWSRPNPAVHYGDEVRLTGRLDDAPVFDSFDYGAYLARQGIHGVVRYGAVSVLSSGHGFPPLAWAVGARSALAAALARQLPEPQNSLAQGILLGIRTGIPRELQDAFRSTGTTHILAISGQNMSVVAGLLVVVFGRWLRPRSWGFAVPAILALWAYTVVVGAPPSVLRAAVMASLALVAGALGREAWAQGGLALSAAVLAAWDPYVLQDAGFQLSFGAMAGILLVGPPVQRWLEHWLVPPAGSRWGRAALLFVAEGTAATIAAGLATVPVQAVTFGQVTVAALPTTLLALPPMAPMMPIAGLAAVLGLLPPPANVVAWPFTAVTWVLASAMILVVQAWSLVPLASVSFPPGRFDVAVAYLAGAGAVWWLLRRRPLALPAAARKGVPGIGRLVRERAVAFTVVAGLLAAGVVWWQVLLPPDEVSVTFLDVGEGDATLVESASGRRVLVDGGPSGPVLMRALGAELAPWERTIDLVVLTSPKADHVAGLLEVLRRYQVHAVAESGFEDSTPEYREWQRLVEQQGVRRLTLQRGAQVRLPDLALTALHPTPRWLAAATANGRDDASLVLLLEAHGRRVLLPGDIGAAGEQALLERDDLSGSLLKLAAQGAKGSTSGALLDAVAPPAAVVSAGAGNRFGHPAPEVVSRLGDTPLLRTDLDGSVRLTLRPDGAVLRATKPRATP